MAETKVTPITPTNPYLDESTTPQLNTVTAISSDVANGNKVSLDTDILLIMDNTNVGAQTVTVTSQNDPFGRTADIAAFSLAAGVRANRLFKAVGWSNGNGDLLVTGSHADMKIEAYKV